MESIIGTDMETRRENTGLVFINVFFVSIIESFL